ncbi:unannotated protein [freshwater metagenome]|uniref:Unannotated protein n=1 Tax=freshwater metagenome TaxID=449393 RepID=A0A6J6P9E0_9ZZZZ|nr:aldehyde dehydrogenase family protein [Actinomycetota bacterium]
MTLLRHFINGQWQESASGRVREIRSPHDQHLVAEATEGNNADALRAIDAAHNTFESGIFRSWSWQDRQSLLLRIADLIERDTKIYAKAESGDTAKRFVEAEFDIADVISVFRFNATLKEPGHSVDVGRPEIQSRIAYEPVGVCALIGPWNYPLLQISWKVAPALLAGCSFIVKPSELSPTSAVLLMHTLAEAGVPAGVANLILGAGSEVGTPLTSDPRVDLISFTGGLATGRAIMASAASTVKKVALELGGKNPNIIFADADVDAAIDNAVTAGFLHSGQVCSAGTRLLVEASIHERVVDELVRRAGEITLGGPDNEAAETGPLISEGHLNKVLGYIERAVKEGAALRVGGKRALAPGLEAGWYIEPTVFDGCSTEMACVQEESFGPVITVETFTTEEEAIELGNDTIYGLSGAVWSADLGRCDRVAAALRHGTIWINDYGPYRPEAEWGGFKASGVGRELGGSGLHEYLEAKHLWRNTSPGRSGWFRDSGHP